MNNNKKIALIAGGGTGGHLFPALSIGNELEKNKIKVEYIGSSYGVEKDLFKKLKIKHHLLNITGIQRNKSLKSIYINLLFPFRFIISYIQSVLIIIKVKPSIIIGTGGYASGIPLIAGIYLKVPTVIQDQNSIPGLITKKLQNKVNKIYLGYEIANKIVNNNKTIITGNPIKPEIRKYNKEKSLLDLKLDPNKKTILILGGSQGASPINNYFTKNIEYYMKNDIQIIWQCGNYDFKELKGKINNKNIVLKSFISNMSQVYSASDIVISRAGAITISELTFMGKAMILIPYPQAAENHQNLNAIDICKNKACIIVDQKELSTNIIDKHINTLFRDEEKIRELEKNAKTLSKPNATKDIADNIMEIIK